MIKVVDAIMGAGKTNCAIKMMNDGGSDDQFIYVTPFLKEVERIKRGVQYRTFVEPEHLGFGKLESLKDLLVKGKDIATTHSLLKYIDEETINLMKCNNYTLILDEVLDVLDHIPISSFDIDMLLTKGIIKIDDVAKTVSVDENINYKGKFDEFIETVRTDRVIYDSSNFFLWCFPPEVFNVFKETYLMTYNIDGSLIKPYFDLYNIEFEKYSITPEGAICDYKSIDIVKYKHLINICDNKKLNNIGNDRTSFSVSWYKDKNKKNKIIIRLKSNVVNYFKNIINAKSIDIMWTTYKENKEAVQGPGYKKDSCFCVHNARATNEYRDKKHLAYLVNRFYNPYLTKFFSNNGLSIDNEKYALNEMLQWIFRSQIRNCKSINIYIPSKRMRNLLIDWLKG